MIENEEIPYYSNNYGDNPTNYNSNFEFVVRPEKLKFEKFERTHWAPPSVEFMSPS